MSTSEFHGTKLTALAGAATNAYRFVKHHSTSAAEEEIIEAAGADDRAIGISVDKGGGSGEPPSIGYVTDGYGRLEVTATTALSAGTPLKSAANGIGVTATSGDEYFAILRDPVPDDTTRIVRVLITRGHVPA